MSTPLTRRAAIADLRRLERLAAARRRRVLLALLAVLTAASASARSAGSVVVLGTPRRAVAGLLIVARVSVRPDAAAVWTRATDAILSRQHEKTVFLSRKEILHARHSSEPAKVEDDDGALWDPVPITMPTYVSKPLAPRTVRTIDLSGPASRHPAATSSRTADAAASPAAEAAEPRREADGNASPGRLGLSRRWWSPARRVITSSSRRWAHRGCGAVGSASRSQ